jgi:5-methylcytosine-specific restriction endonuclease McrA
MPITEARRAYPDTPEGRASAREASRRYRQKDRAAAYAKTREWQLAHPEYVRAARARTRAKKLLIADTANTLDEFDWREILNQYDHRCAYCLADSNIELDHKIPLSRGGANTKANVVPACRSCNRTKYDRTPEEWRRSK